MIKAKQNNSSNIATTRKNLDTGKCFVGGIGLLITMPGLLPAQAMPYYYAVIGNFGKWGPVAISGLVVYALLEIATKR